MEALGAGEKIEGYSTLRYKLTKSYTSTYPSWAMTRRRASHEVADIWVAPDLDPIMSPNGRPDLAKAVQGATGMIGAAHHCDHQGIRAT